MKGATRWIKIPSHCKKFPPFWTDIIHTISTTILKTLCWVIVTSLINPTNLLRVSFRRIGWASSICCRLSLSFDTAGLVVVRFICHQIILANSTFKNMIFCSTLVYKVMNSKCLHQVKIFLFATLPENTFCLINLEGKKILIYLMVLYEHGKYVYWQFEISSIELAEVPYLWDCLSTQRGSCI